MNEYVDLHTLFADMPDVNDEVRRNATDRWDSLAKPQGALGRLEDIGVWAAGVTNGRASFTSPRLVIFAGDHGVAQRFSTSAYPSSVTPLMVRTFLTGGAAANALAGVMGIGVRVVDAAVDCESDYADDLDPAVARRRVRRSSGAINVEDALSVDEANAALQLGMDVANEEIDAGADLLIAGDMGIGNTTPAAALIGLLTNNDASLVTGRGTGIDDNAWMRKCAAIRDAMRRGREFKAEPAQLLATVAGADIAAMTGFFLQAAMRKTPVILDGTIVTSAALVAHRVNHRVTQWWQAGHMSTEPAHALALDRLGLTPILEMNMRLGEGTGAVLAYSVVASACAAFGSMATLADVLGLPDDSTAPES